MYTRNLLSVLPFITSSHALKLIISAYGPQPYGSPGTISTLVHTNGTSSLEVTQRNQDCGSQSSWLEVSPDKTKVLCVDEFNPTGSITMLSLDSEGKLTKLSNASTLGGPVSSAFFGKDDKSIALAHVRIPRPPQLYEQYH
jgi:6-phosphogluconolactonase (cycloisomerase 2 family)